MKLKILILAASVNTATSYAQNLTLPDSCICYTDAQDIRCLECLVAQPLKDSLISKQKGMIEYQDSIIRDNKEQIINCGESLTICKEKRKKSIKRGLIGSGLSFVLGFFISLLM